jgi:hypothetical protein
MEASSHVRDILNMTPGVSSATADDVANRIAGGGPGASAALEELQKYVASGAMVSLKADAGTGQRFAMQEYLAYLKSVPNGQMNPQAIAKLAEGAQRDYQRARTEQDARASFIAKGPNADFGQFPKWWAAKQDSLGLVPRTISSGGAGSGDPYANYTMGRNAQGQIVATDGRKDSKGNTRWYLPNEKMLTNWK